MRSSNFDLYLITDRHQTGRRTVTETVHSALDGGVKAVQLREKDLSSAALYRLADELRRLTADYDALFMINDRLDIATAVAADGVQLGVSTLPVAVARPLLAGKIIGYSAHSVDEAVQAQRDGADFVTFGPVYATPSKVHYGAPCGIQRLAEAAAALDIPLFALGGISLANITETLTATIQGVAVISAVLAASDPQAAARALLKKIEGYAQQP